VSAVDRADRAGKAAVAAQEAYLEAVEEAVYRRLSEAFRAARVHVEDFAPHAGYGYHDPAVAKFERVLAMALGTETALFRPQIVSGTQALSLCLEAFVGQAGWPLLFVLGEPYDTLWPVVGWRGGARQSLLRRGRRVEVMPFEVGRTPEGIQRAAPRGPGLAWLQRSMGYQERSTLGVGELRPLIEALHEQGYVVLVDNCYGEWTEAEEPGHAGADLVVGSFLKNPGGGLTPYGAYVAGREELVAAVADVLYGPSLGRTVAPHEDLRLFFQGLYMSPHAVGQALRAAIYAAGAFQALGFPVDPEPGARRGCIVQAITLGSPERLLAFTAALQAASAVDADVRPEPWPMPGYQDPVVLAGGTFVPGATLELSADAALRAPYRVTLQGGVAYVAAREALRSVLATLVSYAS
jgi:cystathionine beta-lyase family protein involved in aluminum resistance